MKIAALIPARAGSKGIPGKNSKLLGDKPLVAYSIESALAAKNISHIIISTDDKSIIEIAKGYGIDVPFIRPSELSNDTAKSIDVVIHAINWYKENKMEFDAICLLQPTNPFRRVGYIDECIETFKEKNVDSLLSMLPVPHEFNAHWLFEPDENGLLHIATGEENIISRRQELPANYYRDGSVYLTKTSVILNQHSLYGKKIGFKESNISHYVNLDTMEDWYKAEQLLKTLYKK